MCCGTRPDSMEAFAELLINYGYWILLAWVLLDQLALPIPALPMILAAGALAGEGHLNVWIALAIVVLGCVPANLFWYWLGVRHGNKVLTVLCRISLEPDTCISSTTSLFHRHGTASLLLSKFVPGLQAIAPPLAGLLGVSIWRFMLVNTIGSLLYGLAFLLPGFWAHEFIAEIGRVIAQYGALSFTVIAALAASWLIWKIIKRQLFLRSLRGRRVEPLDLHARIQAGEPVQVVDLRQRMEFNADPYTIVSAIRVPLDVFDEVVEKLNRERPLVLFCT
ncbi:MAG: VTT domain-containing protein [Proteobacteria bacterium]|nr:VTT domain-containing protein [Pseudomonadota bacterium]